MDDLLPPWIDFATPDEPQVWSFLLIVPPLIVAVVASFKLTNLSRFRKSLKAKTCSNQKSTEFDRIKTDDLIETDSPLDSSKNGEDSLDFGERRSPSSNLAELPNKDDPNIENSGNNVKKALTSVFDKMRSPVYSCCHTSQSDNALKLETSPINDEYINKSCNDSKQTLPENGLLGRISTGQYEQSKTQENKFKMPGINNQSVRTLETEVSRNSTNDSYSKKADETFSALFPPLESLSNSFSKREPDKLLKPTDNKPTSQNNSDYSYQDYINERLDVEASGENRKPIQRRHIDETQTDDLNMILQNKRDPYKPESKLNKEYNNTHFDDDDSSLWSRSSNSTNKTMGQHNRTLTSLQSRKNYLSEEASIVSSIQGAKLNFTPILGKPKTPDLYAPQTDFETKNIGFNTSKAVSKASHLQETAQKINQYINETTIKPGHLAMNSFDTIPVPGLKPSLGDHPVSSVTQRDFLKFVAPGLTTSYDLVPGPSLLKAVGNMWKYIPILGTQCVSSFIFTLQSIASSMDRNGDYPFINPYYYLLNKYGPMVRLHKPLGADILLLAVNGQDFPIVHTKRKESNYQSLFDSLNVYRNEAPSLNHMLDIPASWSQLPDNSTLSVDQYYSSLEKITEDFIREKRFIYGCNGTTENDSHENDLIRWALQCNLDVYFKSNKKCMADTDSIESNNPMVDSLIKTTKCLRSIETGIQLWRAFTTFTWNNLAEHCKHMDRCILDEVNECLNFVSKGEQSGAAVERLLASEEIRTTDMLTSLLDVLLINVNTVASTTGFLLYNLGRTPQVQRTLFREISGVVKKGSNISYDDLGQLKYLNACITETLRMVPPFPVLKRLLEEDTKIHRFQIPKGTYIHMVNILPYARGDNNYSKISKFQAERWTDKTTLLAGDPLTGLPEWDSFPKFNRDLVMTQIALLVTKVVREYRIEYPQNEIYPNGMVLQGPSSPFNFTFMERQI